MVRKMSGVRAEDDEDEVIDVDVSDDEKYNSENVFEGLWIPYPDQVAEMFEKLDKGGVPVLKWKCPGRRPPEVEKEEEDMETDLNLAVEPKQEEQKEEKKVPQPTEFDFDEETSTTKLTPRKTPGSSKGKKRVARMDKVLDDMFRSRKATEASKDQRKKASPKTPRGGAAGGRFFSSPRTPMSAEKYAPSITPPTTPRSSGAKSPHGRLLSAKYTPPFRSAPTSPRTPSSPKTPTSADRTPVTSPVGGGPMTTLNSDKEQPSPSLSKVMESDASENTAKTTSVSMMVTSTSSTTKCTPLTQALMSEPMASTPSATMTTAESIATSQFLPQQTQITRTEALQNLSRVLPNLGRKTSLTTEGGGLSTQLTISGETPSSQTGTIVGQSIQTTPTTQTRFVPSNLLQPSTESSLLTRDRFVAPSDAIASNQERFTLATMGGQSLNRAAQPTAVSQASELPSPSGRERLTLASMLQPFDIAGLSQQDKQTLSTLTQSRDLSFLQNSENEGSTGGTTSQQFLNVNKPATTTGFPQTHMQMGESQVPTVSQSYIMPSYGVSAMIGKPPPPYSVAVAEKALSSMRTSIAGRKDTNIVSQLPSATVPSLTTATDKTVTFVKKPETSLPSTTVYLNPPNTSSDIGTNIVSSHSSVVKPQLGISSQPTAAGSQLSVQKISLQQAQQSALTTGEINKVLTEKDDKQTLDLVNTSLSAVRTAISMGNQMYPQTVAKDNLLICKNLLGFSSLNKPSTASDTTSVTPSGISSIAANNSLLQHMLGTSTSEHLTSTTSKLIPSAHDLNLQKMSLSSASSVTSSSNLGALTSSHTLSQPSTTPTTSSSRPRLTTIAALLNIDSGPKTQAELQLRQLAMAGITTDGSSLSNLGQTLSIISPASGLAANKTICTSSITTANQVTMVPATMSRPNPASQLITSTADSFQTEQQQQQQLQNPTSES